MDALHRKLSEIFAPDKSGLSGTATVLTSPSAIDTSIANLAASEVDLDMLAASAGTIAARVLADALDQRALRPADYADIPEVSGVMAVRLAKLLPDSEAFQKAFNNALRMRG